MYIMREKEVHQNFYYQFATLIGENLDEEDGICDDKCCFDVLGLRDVAARVPSAPVLLQAKKGVLGASTVTISTNFCPTRTSS